MKKHKVVYIGIIIILLLCSCFFSTSGEEIRCKVGQKLEDFYYRLEAESTPEQEIDFVYWQSRNPEIYAWIRVDGTKIDYPILQSEIDGYYLSHDVDKESNIYGAIYTEIQNNKDFNDLHTVIYGHNMRDGSMFGSLKDFADSDFFERYDTFTIFLPEETRQYQIVAAYCYPAEHLLKSFDFSSSEAAEEYFQSIPGFVQDTGGCMREEISIQAPLVTLSTCTADDASMRYLVQGVMIEKITNEQEEEVKRK